MYDDPIVAETRRLREEYAARFNHDIDAICDDLEAQQKASGKTVVHREPQRPRPQPPETTMQSSS